MGGTIPMRLPDLPEGHDWWAVFVEIVRRPGAETEFLEAGEGGAFSWICLPAESADAAKLAVMAEVLSHGVGLADAEEPVRIAAASDITALGEDDTSTDPELEAAFSDPDLGAELVWGAIYTYPLGEEPVQ